jgi:putative membrane protein
MVKKSQMAGVLMPYLLCRIAVISSCALLSAPLAIAQGVPTSTHSTLAKPSPSVHADDAKFLKEAAEGGMAEVELGQLAVQKAASPQVKQFAERMVEDHGKANDQVHELALQKSIRLPKRPSAKNAAAKARLEKLSGDEFDRAYMADMVADHKKDVADFQRESSAAHDPAVKNFATQTLPTLQDHLKQAQSIAPAQ